MRSSASNVANRKKRMNALDLCGHRCDGRQHAIDANRCLLSSQLDGRLPSMAHLWTSSRSTAP